jgi:hypothetical protein
MLQFHYEFDSAVKMFNNNPDFKPLPCTFLPCYSHSLDEMNKFHLTFIEPTLKRFSKATEVQQLAYSI